MLATRLEDPSARPTVFGLAEELLACAREDRTLVRRETGRRGTEVPDILRYGFESYRQVQARWISEFHEPRGCYRTGGAAHRRAPLNPMRHIGRAAAGGAGDLLLLVAEELQVRPPCIRTETARPRLATLCRPRIVPAIKLCLQCQHFA